MTELEQNGREKPATFDGAGKMGDKARLGIRAASATPSPVNADYPRKDIGDVENAFPGKEKKPTGRVASILRKLLG